MSKVPNLNDQSLTPLSVGAEEVYISTHGDWVVVRREYLEGYIGRPLIADTWDTQKTTISADLSPGHDFDAIPARDEEPTIPQIDDVPPRRASQSLNLLNTILVIVAGVFIVVLLSFWSSDETTEDGSADAVSSEVSEIVRAQNVADANEDVPTPDAKTESPQEEPPAETEQDQVAAEPPPAAQEAPPEAKPKKAAPKKQKSPLERGWDQVDSNPSAAILSFEKALAQDPESLDANYGYGYALLKVGNRERARQHLCKAGAKATGADKIDIDGILTRSQLTCD